MVLLVSWAPKGLSRFPISLAMICVGLGVAIFSLDVMSFDPDPRTWDTLTERLTELVVIISLMGAGLKLDRPVSLKGWGPTWRLLVIAMPLTIGATTTAARPRYCRTSSTRPTTRPTRRKEYQPARRVGHR